jgi:hypothetical protein
MAGAGIAVNLDKDFQEILNALSRMSNPDKRGLLNFIGGELTDITEQAFQNEADPGTGEKWAGKKRLSRVVPALSYRTPVIWANQYRGCREGKEPRIVALCRG